MNLWLQADVLVNTPSGKGDHLAKWGVVSKAFYNAGGDDLQQVSKHPQCFSTLTFDLLQQSGLYVAILLIVGHFLYTELAGL